MKPTLRNDEVNVLYEAVGSGRRETLGRAISAAEARWRRHHEGLGPDNLREHCGVIQRGWQVDTVTVAF
jgi:hypothetical protein